MNAYFIAGTDTEIGKTERGIAYDVAVINYGYQGRTIACALKYVQGDKVGTQLMFGDRGPNGMYTVYVTD